MSRDEPRWLRWSQDTLQLLTPSLVLGHLFADDICALAQFFFKHYRRRHARLLPFLPVCPHVRAPGATRKVAVRNLVELQRAKAEASVAHAVPEKVP